MFKANMKGENYRNYRIKCRTSLQPQRAEKFLNNNKTCTP